jgi:hypothetical protein
MLWLETYVFDYFQLPVTLFPIPAGFHQPLLGSVAQNEPMQ